MRNRTDWDLPHPNVLWLFSDKSMEKTHAHEPHVSSMGRTDGALPVYGAVRWTHHDDLVKLWPVASAWHELAHLRPPAASRRFLLVCSEARAQ